MCSCVRLLLSEAVEVVGLGSAVWCVSPSGQQVLTDRLDELHRLDGAGWSLFADVAAYEQQHGENIAAEVETVVPVGMPTGLDILYEWIGSSSSEEERQARTAYGAAWVKGQHRLGVLSAEQMQRALHRLTAGHTIKSGQSPHPFDPQNEHLFVKL